MKLLEEDFTGNDKDTVANFEQKKTIIFRKLESVEDKEMLINYLLKFSKPLSNQSKWYLIATDIFTIYEQKILNYKDISSSQFHPMAKQDETQNEISNYKSSFWTEEKELINILFRACMEAKREKVAKDLLKLSEENGFSIEDEKGYKTRLFIRKKKTSVTNIARYIYSFIFFALVILDRGKNTKLTASLLFGLLIVMDIATFFYERNKTK